jgi:TonB family protein
MVSMNVAVPTVCLLVSLVGADVLAAQSLGDLAQQEEARRKALAAPAKVITDKDLRPVAPPPETPPAPAASASVPLAKGLDDDRIAVAAAQYKDGALPPIPVQAVSGGEVLLEVTVSNEGRVVGVTTLRHTPPFTEALTAAVRTWQFRPAEDAAVPKPGELADPKTRKAVESKVLVVGLFRPPAFYSSTIGEPPKDVAVASEEIPLPVVPAKMPLYPPLAVADGVVLAELRVGADGRLVDAAVIRSTPGFDQPTLDALQPLSFRAARVHGLTVTRFAYVVAAFRRPVTGSGGGDQSPNPKSP